MREGMLKLRSFPRSRLIEVPLCHLRTSELSLYQSLGDPTATTDPVEADPRLYWDIQWSCGMVMGLQFHQISEDLQIQLDQPDVPHALRHLGRRGLRPAPRSRVEDPERSPGHRQGPSVLDWELHREPPGRHRPAATSEGLTERDAECWAAEAEALTGRRHWAETSDATASSRCHWSGASVRLRTGRCPRAGRAPAASPRRRRRRSTAGGESRKNRAVQVSSM